MGRWMEQDSNSQANVQVSSDGYDRQSDTAIASEFIVQEKGAGGAHVHLGFDEYGNQVFENRR